MIAIFVRALPPMQAPLAFVHRGEREHMYTQLQEAMQADLLQELQGLAEESDAARKALQVRSASLGKKVKYQQGLTVESDTAHKAVQVSYVALGNMEIRSTRAGCGE